MSKNNISYPLLESFSKTVDINEISANYPLVKEIQSSLREGELYGGTIDGIWGQRTQDAFIKFKKIAYLEYPYSLGKSTATALLELVGKAIHEVPKDSWLSTQGSKKLKLPAGKVVIVSQLIPGSSHFTWGEATALGTRKPANSQVVKEIIRLAEYLDRVRAFLGNRRIDVTSWYRPLDINLAVGGVSNSTHILGMAGDFTVEGIPPLDVYRLLHPWHGRIGGLGRSTRFTHLDLRGYAARWNYSS